MAAPVTCMARGRRCAPNPSWGDLGAAQKQPGGGGGHWASPTQGETWQAQQQEAVPPSVGAGGIHPLHEGTPLCKVLGTSPRVQPQKRSACPAFTLFLLLESEGGGKTSTGALSAIRACRASPAKGNMRGDQRAQSTSAAPGTSPTSQASLPCPLGAVFPSAQDSSGTIPTSTQLCSTGRAPMEEPRNTS